MHMTLTVHNPLFFVLIGAHQPSGVILIALSYLSTSFNIVSTDHATELTTCYHVWITKWYNHIREVPTTIQVPLQASNIHTPLIIGSFSQAPLSALDEFFFQWLPKYFRIGLNHAPDELKSACWNHTSALQLPQVVEDYLATETLHHCVSGPFSKSFYTSVQINRI